MADLGTLWFGADVDLTKLKQSINQGNQSILDALKMNYDPQSYQQMVAKLKQQLASETFQINVSTNAQSVVHNLQQSLNSVGGTGIGLNPTGLKGINAMTSEILNQRDAILDNKKAVRLYKEEWGRAINQFGRTSSQAMSAYKEYSIARNELRKNNWELESMNINRGRAALSQKALNEQMREAQRTAKQWNSDHMRLNATLAGGIHVSTQLGSALSTLFAVDAARQFLGNVIEIGGQLEKQRISIGAILGDTVKANHLFEQIKDLAVKSPFGVVELDQYTKQLAAYGFQYNELFDMTKRLADISAGAGQDIGRLTLALGHVRSATYLTGITLRQFSMNNIPMLKMLSEYYTELEGKMVSTAEVQKRISERKVSYEDVIEQIRRLTDEGGMFYNMQEKISESLAAKYKNLKDAMDIMYGEMAEGSVGDMLKGLAGVLLTTTRHWKEVANVMGVAAAAFMVSKINIGLQTATMQGNTAATIKQIMSTKQLEANNLRAAASYRKLSFEELRKVATARTLTAQDISLAVATKQLTKDEVLNAIALKKVSAAEAQALVTTGLLTQAEVNAALATNKWSAKLAVLGGKLKSAFAGVGMGTWATIGLMVGAEIYSAYNSWVDKIDDKSKEMQDLIKSRIIDLEKERKALENEGKPKDQKELQARIDSMKQVLANSEAYTKTIDQQVNSAGSLGGQYDILAGAIDNAIERNRRLLDVQSDVADMIKASSVYSGEGFFDKLGQGARWFFNDDIMKNMSQTQGAYKELRQTIDAAWEYRDAIKGVIEEMINAGTFSKDFEEYLKNAPFEEQIRLLAESQYWDQIVDRIVFSDVNFVNFADRLKEAAGGVTERWDEIANDDIPRMMKRIADKRGMDEKELREWAVNNIDDFKMMLDGINDQLDIKEPAIRQRINRLFYDYVRLGQVAKGVEAGALIGGNVFDSIYDQLKDEELATLKSDNGGENGSGGSKNKKDKALEAAKTKLQEYKNFLSEYKKLRELYSKEKAIDILEKTFPGLKGQGAEIIDNYPKVLDELRNSFELTTDARKKFANEVDKTKVDTLFDREKEAMKEASDAMEDYADKLEKQWKDYRKLLKKTNNRDFANLAFNDKGSIWDDTAKKLLEKFNEEGAKAGVIPVEFSWDLNEDDLKKALVNADGQTQSHLVKLAQKIQKITHENYVNLLEDAAEAYEKTLTTADKVVNAERELAELDRQRKEYNGDDLALIKAMDVLYEAKEKELEQLRRDAFKESADYLNFYNAILSVTIPEAEKIGKAIKQNLNDELKSGKLSARQYLTEIKKINEQMEKLRNSHSDLNSFMSGGLEGLFQNRAERGENQWMRGVNEFQKAQQDFDRSQKDYAKAVREGDYAGVQNALSQQQAAESAKEGAEAMMKGGEAMSSGANSAMSTVAIIDKIVHGINDVVQGVKDAFYDIKETYDAMGEDTSGDNWTEWGAFFSSFSSASNSATSAWDSLKNGNFGGVISGVVGSFTGWIKGVAKAWDAKMDRLIREAQESNKAIERLRSSIERDLERALGGVYEYSQSARTREELYEARGRTEIVDSETYSERQKRSVTQAFKWSNIGAAIGMVGGWIGAAAGAIIGGLAGAIGGWKTEKYQVNYYDDDTLAAIDKALYTGKYFDTELALLYEQRDEIRHQMEAEQRKKDSDDEAIAEYQQQMEELNDKIDHYALDMAKALYDIDIKSWASELTDAIVSAWENGEDAVAAYNKKVKEMMKDLTKNIITQKILEKTLQLHNIDKLIEDLMTDNSGVLDENAVAALGEGLMGAGEDATKATVALLDYLEKMGYISKATASAFGDLRSTFLDTLTNMEDDAESFRKKLEQTMVKDLIEKQVLDVPFTINGKTFEDFNAYLTDWNKRYAEAVKSGNQEAIDALIDELVKARELTVKAAQELRERLNEATEDDTFKGMSDSWVSNLMDMSKTAEDWAEEVGKVMAEKIIKEMIVPTLIQPYLNQLQEAWNTALPQYTTTEENGNKTYNWEGLLGDSAVRGALEAITAAYPAASDAVKTVLEKLDIDISNYKYSGFSNLADSILDSLSKSNGSLADWAKEQGQNMAKQMAQAYIDQNYGDEITKLNEEWQQALEEGDAEAIATVEAKLDDLYKRMANDQDLMNLIDDFKELDTTVTGMADSFVNSLMDMSKSAQDWAQDLAKTIATAVIKLTVVPTLIQPLLQGVQDVFNNAIEAATSVDENGKKTVNWEAIINNADLMAAINGLVEQYPEIQGIVEKIMSAFGVDMYENPFSDMVSEFTSSLMDMEQSAEDFALSISKKLTEQMIEKVITDGYKGQIDQLGEQWREALENGDVAAIERIKNQLVELREQMGEAVQPLLDSISDLEKQTNRVFSSMTDSWVSALMDMESSAEDFAQEVGKTMVKEIITSMIAPKFLQPILDAMQKAFNLAINVPGATIQSVMQQMKPYLSQITSVYNEVFPMIQELFDGFGIVTETVEEAAEEVQYALQDLKSDFVSSLMDMTSSAEDFAQEISKILAKSFIEKFVLGDAFDARMKQWQEQYERILGSGMSEEERKKQLKQLRDAIAAAREDYTNQAMAIMELMGITTEDSQEATTNMSDKITYDQADQLLGIELAQLLTQEQILATMHGAPISEIENGGGILKNVGDAIASMKDNNIGTATAIKTLSGTVADDHQSQVIASTIQSLLDTTRNNNDNILTQVAMANSHLQMIRDYSKKICDQVELHMASMDSKLSHLKEI